MIKEAPKQDNISSAGTEAFLDLVKNKDPKALEALKVAQREVLGSSEDEISPSSEVKPPISNNNNEDVVVAGQFGSKSPDFARENTLSDSAGAQHKVILQKALEYLQEDGKRVDDPNSLMQNLMDFQEQKSKKG